jgi:hypothetical protein
MSEDTKKGGLGGILIGIATLLTAIVGLLSYMKPNTPTTAVLTPTPSVLPPSSSLSTTPTSSPVDERKIRAEIEQEVRQEFGVALTSKMSNLLTQIEESKSTQQNSNGLFGFIRLKWVDLPQVAIALMNGSYGMMRVTFPAQGNVEIVDQDLIVKNYQGNLYIVSSNSRYAGTTTSHLNYAPDIFLVQQNPNSGLYQIAATCDARYVCSRIITEAIY